MSIIDTAQIKPQFPMLADQADLVYLDTGASSQTPEVVLDAVNKYYRAHRANVHRGMYDASEEATDLYEGARKKVADFISSDTEEVIFTRGTTESLNLVAESLGSALKQGDEVVITGMEHHANLVPWQQASKKYGFTLQVIPVTKTFELDMNQARALIGPNTKVVSFTWASNVLGTINPVEELIGLAKAQGALTVIDAAQAVGHISIDVRALDCDFLAFSGHKMFGPTGIGVLYGKRALLEKMEPLMFGGDMIREVSWEGATWNELPYKFEAGTPNIAGAIGLGAAIDFVQSIGTDALHSHETELMAYAEKTLTDIPLFTAYSPPKGTPRLGILSFSIGDIHPHDTVTLLNEKRVAVRGGHHCAMPLMLDLGVPGTTRASFSIYNTKEDIDRLKEAIIHTKNTFRI